MSKTVAIVSDAGRLTNTFGVNRESDSRYSKFAKRLLGDSGTVATLNYGWNGRDKLTVGKDGTRGQLITLDAETVVVPATLKVAGTSLTQLIDDATDMAIYGISGTTGQIKVTTTRNDDSSSGGGSRLSCVIALSDAFLQRISGIEASLDDLFRFGEVYSVGDGLTVNRAASNSLRVKIGNGLKFTPVAASEEEQTQRVAVDADAVPTPGSTKPVTSGGVYDAILGGYVHQAYYVAPDPVTGNMVLYHNPDSSGND